MSVQYCGNVPQSQFLLLATPVASTLLGSSDGVLHFRLANMPWQSTAAALVAGVGATVDGVGATVDDDVAGIAATVDGVGSTVDEDVVAARVVDDVAAFEGVGAADDVVGAGVADDVVGVGVTAAFVVADAEGLTSAPLLLHVQALGL